MPDQTKSRAAILTLLNIFSLSLQVVIMALLATDRMTTSLAVPLLGIVVLTGFILPMALKKPSI
jgi:hypothetical protein